jgi:cytidylate kinase
MSIITISRGTKSGGLELANHLSKRLGYETLSMEMVIAESAKKYNIMKEILLDKLEKTPSLWQKFTDEYARYIIFIKCSLLKAIKQDKIIYHGYAGQLLLKDLPHVLKLRVEAPLEYRVKAVMAELNYTYDQSVDYIKKVDIQRKRWVKMVYNNDWYNPHLYDLWVNLQHMSMDNICEMVALSIDHEDFKTSEHAIMCLNNMSLECEVRAALASDDEIWRNQEVTVNAYDGIIILRGTTKNKQLRDLIVDTTSKVKGVKECKSDISLLSDGLTK